MIGDTTLGLALDLLAVLIVLLALSYGAALREIRRVLTPEGRAVIGIRRPALMRLAPVTWFGFRLYSVRRAEEMLRAAGFRVTIRERVKGEVILLASRHRIEAT